MKPHSFTFFFIIVSLHISNPKKTQSQELSREPHSENSLSGNYKIVRDERGRLSGLYYICGHDTASIEAEEYDYSEYDNGIINCTFSYYVEGRSGASKDIPTGFKNSPLQQWKYIFYVNEKGKFICYDSYKNKNGEFVLIKKNAKK